MGLGLGLGVGLGLGLGLGLWVWVWVWRGARRGCHVAQAALHGSCRVAARSVRCGGKVGGVGLGRGLICGPERCMLRSHREASVDKSRLRVSSCTPFFFGTQETLSSVAAFILILFTIRLPKELAFKPSKKLLSRRSLRGFFLLYNHNEFSHFRLHSKIL